MAQEKLTRGKVATNLQVQGGRGKSWGSGKNLVDKKLRKR